MDPISKVFKERAMTLKELMKTNKIVVGVKHIKAHKRDLYGVKNMIKYLQNNPAKLKNLGMGYSLIIVKEGGLVFIYSVQKNKIVNWENKTLQEFVTGVCGNSALNDKLWELV